MKKYSPVDFETKWLQVWEKEQLHATKEIKNKKKYVLDMFPYPSGSGMHVGHLEGYIASDIYARYFRMKGYGVLHPMGFDAFGLPAENFAIKSGVHPQETTDKAIGTYRSQMDPVGLSYDWSREVRTHDPAYYRFTQWLFLLLYKRGLAYRKKGLVNWCPKDATVLANEQVVKNNDGENVCERCESLVEQRDMEQWYFRITDYAERLLNDLDKLDWPDSTKLAQKNWIGKSEGVEVKFSVTNKINNTNLDIITVFTSRIDTLFGVTFLVLAPESTILPSIMENAQNKENVKKYIKSSKEKTSLQRQIAKEKTGVQLEGINAVHPLSGEKLPIFVSDYVLGGYGTGAVMGVPAHDERDSEFAKKFDIPSRKVICREFGDSLEGEVFVDGVSCVIFDPKNQKFLFLKWPTWTGFVSGSSENDESLEDTAIREIREETSYEKIDEIIDLDSTYFGHYHSEAKKRNVASKNNGMLVFVDSNISSPQKLEQHENFEQIWLDVHQGYQVIKDVIANYPGVYYWQIHFEKAVRILVERGMIDFDTTVFAPEKQFTGYGKLINSSEFDNLTSSDAQVAILKKLEGLDLGKAKTMFKLRDWLISRQRYWGAPIPMRKIQKLNIKNQKYIENIKNIKTQNSTESEFDYIPVLESELPVILPHDVDFTPTGRSPLTEHPNFEGREVDTMDTFVDSSWYFLRYCDPHNDTEFASKEAMELWCPVDLYLGGAEHTVLHLLYSRFFTKVLFDAGYINFDEPFLKLRHQGMILGPDHRKMSKRWGNVIDPRDVISEYGADTLRIYEMFMGPLDIVKPWDTKGIAGANRFLKRIWEKYEQLTTHNSQVNSDKSLANKLNKLITKVSADIEELKYNTAIAAMMSFINEWDSTEKVTSHKSQVLNQDDMEKFLQILAPFAPFMTEEIWREKLGHTESIHLSGWPEVEDLDTEESSYDLAVQINGKLRGVITLTSGASQEDALLATQKNIAIAKYLTTEIKKVIFIPKKILNIVV